MAKVDSGCRHKGSLGSICNERTRPGINPFLARQPFSFIPTNRHVASLLNRRRAVSIMFAVAGLLPLFEQKNHRRQVEAGGGE
jgi:hypothetical protein